MSPIPSVQKVGAVLRKAGFERSRWLKSGQIKGWGRSTEGYSVKLHWDGYVKVTHYAGEYDRGTDEEREARHDAKIAALAEALTAAGLIAERQMPPPFGWSELRVTSPPAAIHSSTAPESSTT